MRDGDPRAVGGHRLEARLGAGGMGQVYLGTSPGGRRVAVKVVHARFAADPRFRARFAREIEAARKVGGFHTAQVVDADPDAQAPWMVTAHVPGPSLRRQVLGSGPLAPARVREVGAALAEGVAAIHAAGLVHRDLKPGNVIMSPDGPRIIDFGIAHAIEATALTSTGTVVGTYSFMSPEQVRAAQVGPPSDVFSLGCVLAFAATGWGPFDASTIPAIVHRIVSGPPVLDGIDGELRELIAACLDKDPARRPSPAQLVARLNAPVGAGSPGRSTVARRALIAGALAAGAAAVAVPSVLLLTGDETASGGPPPPTTPVGTPRAVTLPVATPEMYGLAFTPDASRLVGAGWDGIWRWDLASGRAGNTEIEDWDRPVAVSGDGRLYAGTTRDGPVEIRDAATGRVLSTLPRGVETSALAFTPDGRTLAVGVRADVRLWDVRARRFTRDLRGTRQAEALVFSPDGRWLAEPGGAQVWEVATGARKGPFEDASGSGAVAFTGDGRTVALALGGYEHKIALYDVPGGRRRELFEMREAGRVSALAFSPDGHTLAVGDEDGQVHLRHLPGRRVTAVVDADPDQVNSLVFSPDGQSFASGGGSGATRLWRF